MSEWPADFEKKLVEAHHLKETSPACPAPCHGRILADPNADGSAILKCVKCGASTTYTPPTPP